MKLKKIEEDDITQNVDKLNYNSLTNALGSSKNTGMWLNLEEVMKPKYLELSDEEKIGGSLLQ